VNHASSQAGASERIARLRWALFILLGATYLASLMIGPRVPDAYAEYFNAINIEIAGWFGHSLNTDSPGFMRDAAHPRRLLASDAMRQGRPGSAALVHVLSLPFESMHERLKPGFGWPLRATRPADARRVARIQPLLPQYLGFIVFHALTLAACIAVFFQSLSPPRKGLEAALFPSFWLALLIVANDLTKQFFWSPHTQLLGLLAALLAVTLPQRLLETDRWVRVFLGGSALLGVLSLFYGVFVVAAVCSGLAVLWRQRAHLIRFSRDGIAVIAVAGLGAGLFAVPSALWIGTVIALNGSFFHYDVEVFRGFVWLADKAPVIGWKGVGAELMWLISTNAFNGIRHGWHLFLGLGLAAFLAGRNLDAGSRQRLQRLLTLAGIYAGLLTVFFSLYGVAVIRVSAGIPIALLPALALVLDRLHERSAAMAPLTWAAVVAYLAFSSVKFGPYS
jgi:hypothetical protein